MAFVGGGWKTISGRCDVSMVTLTAHAQFIVMGVSGGVWCSRQHMPYQLALEDLKNNGL